MNLRLHLPLALGTLLCAAAQEFPKFEEPPLPQHGPPEPEAAPSFIPLGPRDVVGTWHGIEAGGKSYTAWEIRYRQDGTYELRLLARPFDTGDPDRDTVEELSEGSWSITPDGSLDFDQGEMLFKAVAVDDTGNVYTASYPDDPDSGTWTVHEFPGVAPAVIFDLAPWVRKKDADGTASDPERKQLAKLRRLLLGCSAFAVENGGQFPARLSQLEPNFGADVLADLRLFRYPENDARTPWILVAGRTITDPHGTILMHSPAFGEGRRMVGFIDGRTAVLSEEAFNAALGE